MSGLIDSVFDVVDTLIGGGDDAPQSAAAPAPVIDMSAITESNTLLTQQIAELTRQNELLAQESGARTEALQDQIKAMTAKPPTMPSATSSDVRTAKRKAAASLARRGGRSSTLLTEAAQDTLG